MIIFYGSIEPIEVDRWILSPMEYQEARNMHLREYVLRE